ASVFSHIFAPPPVTRYAPVLRSYWHLPLFGVTPMSLWLSKTPSLEAKAWQRLPMKAIELKQSTACTAIFFTAEVTSNMNSTVRQVYNRTNMAGQSFGGLS